ncbi:MAG: peptidylprolyl isomerase, partial [Coprobacillus sp.]|nr:peptidylprolyl isomerase [Coprobacillus sp.]
MKRNKRNIALITSCVAALCLTSCDVTPSDTAIVSFTGYNGEEIALITNDFYEKYRNTEDGVTTFYNAIMEVLTRYVFENGYVLTPGDLDSAKNLDEIKVEADKNVLGAKQDCKDSATNSSSSYDKEWDSYLEGLGLEDEDELTEYFIYNIEKEEIEDWYFDNHVDELKEEYIGVSDAGEAVSSVARSSFPYHIRHILVNVSDESSSFTRGTLTESEAERMSTVLTMLNQGTLTFGEIAYRLSEDTGSADAYGDAGIMDTNTSFVNEFKLGIYAYDSVYASHEDTVGNEAIEDGLGLSGEFTSALNEDVETVRDEVEQIELGKVPYGVFDLLNFYSDVEKDENGLDVNDGNTASYPRNIIWNEYLNLHNAFVIT